MEANLTNPGPYPVATRDFTFVDSSRSTPANGAYAGAADRTILTRVWYPAEPASDGAATTEPSKAGPFPVVLYAHGFLSSRSDVPLLKTHLASHGYVVVAPEFPLSSGGAKERPTIADLASQPGDLAFAVAEVGKLGGSDAALASALDTSRMGAVGYSLGGTTVLLAAYHPKWYLPEIQVAVAFAPATCGSTENLYQRSLPTVIVGGSADQLVPFHTILDAVFAWAKPPLTLVKLRGGTHQGFAGGSDSVPASNDDTLPCRLTQNTLGCSLPTYPELSAKLAEGVGGPAFEPSTCGALCEEQYLQGMSSNRQLELTKAITLAKLEAVLRKRADSALYLRDGLKLSSDVVVIESGVTSDFGPADPAPQVVACTATSPDAGACNDVVNAAAQIPTTVLTTPAPDGTGGALVDGPYFLTKVETYAGSALPNTATWQETIVLTGATAQMVANDSLVGPFRKTFAVATSGTGITLTTTCGTPPVPITSYTATPTSFTLYSAPLAASRTYTKQ